jgi:hypothetical protein
LLSLELWQQEFHDREHYYQGLLASRAVPSYDKIGSAS